MAPSAHLLVFLHSDCKVLFSFLVINQAKPKHRIALTTKKSREIFTAGIPQTAVFRIALTVKQEAIPKEVPTTNDFPGS